MNGKKLKLNRLYDYKMLRTTFLFFLKTENQLLDHECNFLEQCILWQGSLRKQV